MIKTSHKEIIANRVLNHIEFIKHHLAKRNQDDLYNDFLIVSQIAPKLPQEILLEMLHLLKPLNDFMN